MASFYDKMINGTETAYCDLNNSNPLIRSLKKSEEKSKPEWCIISEEEINRKQMTSKKNKPTEPRKSNKKPLPSTRPFNEYSTGIMRYISSICCANRLHIMMLYGLLDKPKDLINDLNKSQYHANKLCYKYSYALTADGLLLKNIIIIDGVLEFLPGIMLQAMFLRGLASNLFMGQKGHLIIKSYSDEYLKKHSAELKLESKNGSYYIDAPENTKVFVQGLTKSDVSSILKFGRIGSIEKIPMENIEKYDINDYTFVTRERDIR